MDEKKTQLSQSVSLWCMGCLLWYHIICSERTFPGDLTKIFHHIFQIINNKSLIRVTICRAIFDDVIRGSLLIWKHGVWRELRAICTTGAGGTQSVHQCAKCAKCGTQSVHKCAQCKVAIVHSAKCGTQSVHQCKISTIRCIHTPCTMHWRHTAHFCLSTLHQDFFRSVLDFCKWQTPCILFVSNSFPPAIV